MMRSRALVHWGSCWAEAPVAGIAWFLDGAWAYVLISYSYSANKSIVMGKKEVYTHVATNIVKGIEWPIDTLN
jgi:hypothetical protein